ncbi:MAG: hypothetical protein CL532_05180 [Aestuariivita sp.]|nr:hypothetical protein [Aestuariivita sp.]
MPNTSCKACLKLMSFAAKEVRGDAGRIPKARGKIKIARIKRTMSALYHSSPLISPRLKGSMVN